MQPWEKPGMTVEERARAVMDAPVYGPQTLYDNLTSALRAAVRDAVEAEREQCAAVAWNTATGLHDARRVRGAYEAKFRIKREDADAIAAAIRARNGGGK